MGAVPSTPLKSSRPQDTAEYLISTFVGEKSFPLSSDFWYKLLELPFTLQWPNYRVRQACEAFVKNNYDTRHLAKILIYLVLSLQECMSTTSGPSTAYMKAINAAYISSVFMKYAIENAKSENFEELYLSLREDDAAIKYIPKDQNIGSFVMHGVLSFIGTSEVSSQTYLLHHELLNFVLVAMSTQLRSGPTPGPKDVHPFIDAAMDQESSVVGLVVRRLLLNYITRPRIPSGGATHSIFSEGGEPGVLHKVGSAAANLVLMPFNYFVGSSGDISRNPLADNSLLLLLSFVHYRKCVMVAEPITDKCEDAVNFDSLVKENSYFSENHYCKALENARDVEFDRADIEGNVHSGPLVRLSFASLFDTLGLHLADEGSVLLLYSLVHGNSDFLEYVLVRTDLDTLVYDMQFELNEVEARRERYPSIISFFNLLNALIAEERDVSDRGRRFVGIFRFVYDHVFGPFPQRAYADQSEKWQLVVACFQHFRIRKPDEFTISCALSACASLVATRSGEQIQGYTVKTGLGCFAIIGNSQICMYAKAGDIDVVNLTFKETETHDVVSWSVMISSHEQHGCANDALRFYKEMNGCGVAPNHVTFVGVLTACSHGGLVDEGLGETAGDSLDLFSVSVVD